MPGAGYGKWSLSDARRRQHGSAHSEGPSAIPESKLEARSLFCRCKSREALVPRISGRLSNASVGRADCCHFTNDLLERSTTKSDSRLLRFYLFRGAWGSSPDIGPIPHPPVPQLSHTSAGKHTQFFDTKIALNFRPASRRFWAGFAFLLRAGIDLLEYDEE